MRLTSEIVGVAQARERRYVLSDGHGMSLHVMPWGTKWWRFRYRFRRREKMISLGIYPRVTLATARLHLADARGLLARGIDPSAERRARRAATVRTLGAVARDWLKGLEVPVAKGLVTADTLKDATRILERHVFPELGARPIGGIQPHELLAVLTQIELKGLRYTALRAKQRCSRVFRYAVGHGYIERDITFEPPWPPPASYGAPSPRHHRSAASRRTARCDRQLRGTRGDRHRLKTRPPLLCAPRELRKARWEQFDFERRQWRIPARCMKARVQHLVPLSRQALDLLERLRSLTGDSEYLFPLITEPGRPSHGGALSCALQSLGSTSRR